MKNLIKIFHLFLVLIMLNACKTKIEEDNLIKNSKEILNGEINELKEKIEIRFSCGEDGISKYLDDGWTVVKEYSEEKICTWKSVPATKDCDMEKDKGCKITKPDKIGVEKIYLLEK